TVVGSDVTAGGDSSAAAVFDPATTPANFMVGFSLRDHAGNECASTQPYRVVYDGCPITVTAPLAPVTVDADGDGTNGAQVDIGLAVDAACVGQMVTSDCGSNSPGAPVGAGGVTTLRADVCDTTPCEASSMCTVHVTSPDGIETTAGVELSFDNQPPNVAVAVAAPGGVSCGGVVTPEQDTDVTMPGVQARIRVTSPNAADRRLQQVSGAMMQVLDANAPGGEVVVTLAVGTNSFTGLASDALGNMSMSAQCDVSLADIVVTYTGAAADGTVGGTDGTVMGGDLTFNLTGTVSIAGASVDVTVDGGAPQAAVVNGTAWTLPLTLASRQVPYAIVATATLGPRTGRANLSLLVDLTAPPVIGNLTAIADTRQSIKLSFPAPSDNGAPAAAYKIRYAKVQLTDANFDTTGTAFAAPAPGAPGAPQTIRVRPLRAGTAYWVGIAAVDAGGNRSPAAIVGPLTPRFDQTPVLDAPNSMGNAGFGAAMVRGRFNDDDFDDVAVAAPFVDANGIASAGEVYVFLGSPTGLGTVPATTIRGVTANGALGSSLTRIHWSAANRDDLVIGEPFGGGGDGVIYVFNGGATFPSGVVAPATAQRRIGVRAATNWFSGSALGWQLATGDHDGDGTEDLIATAVFGNGGTSGAAIVFYGGTVPLGQTFISDTSTAGSGTTVMRMYEDPDMTGSLFGFYLHNLGHTQGPTDTTDDFGVAYAEDGLPNATVVVYRGQGRPGAPGVTRAPFTAGRDVRIREVTVDTVTEWGSTMGSIADQNGDGAREIVIGDYRYQADNGVVYIIDGDTVGTNGTADTTAPGVALTIIAGPPGGQPAQFGMAIVNNANGLAPDVDGDGVEDLIIAGRAPGTNQDVLDVWFGPVGAGSQNPPAPNYVVTGPATFTSNVPGFGGSPISAIWAGDVNADGLRDICWADWTSASQDGGLQILWDDGL
ncbi:MAG TPA: fibronectin type III domain-containing protein, partial [Kofleriaceae bacterium]|nr:fibronectin type III domain-containing protein [Kofleriaceae bacterium]